MVLNPGTSLDTIEYVLDVVDLILIMSGKTSAAKDYSRTREAERDALNLLHM